MTYEDPRPPKQTCGATHKADTVGKKTRERSCDGSCSEEYTNAVLQLVTRIPEGKACLKEAVRLPSY